MPNQPKTPARAVRISDEMWTVLRGIATEREVTISDVVRDALAAAIESHAEDQESNAPNLAR